MFRHSVEDHRQIRSAIIMMFLGIATIGRLAMSLTLHMWFPYSQLADDWLLMSYSLPWYEHSTSHYKLAKNQGFSFWIRIIHATGINVDVMYFMLWLCAAALTALAMHRFFRTRWLTIFSYLYVLWNPLAFEFWSGTRVYRNSVFAPFMFILLALLILYLTAFGPWFSQRPTYRFTTAADFSPDGRRRNLLQGIALIIFFAVIGLVFSLVYDLKEDSIWLIPMFVVIIGIKVIESIRMKAPWLTKATTILLCIVPLIVSFAGIQTIKFANYQRFGVYLLNTRTTGEVAGFISRIYQIDSPNQNQKIWTPVDSIDRAFAASPTLRQYPQIQHFVEHNDFAFPNIHERPLTGDYISWQMLAALNATIGMDDERQVQDLFRQANTEIDAAFASGALPRTHKISLTKSLVPRTPEEITGLVAPSIRYYVNALTLTSQYRVSIGENDDVDYNNPKSWIGLQQLNIDLQNPNPQVIPWFSADDARLVARNIVRMYRLVNAAMVLAFAVIFIGAIHDGIRRRALHQWKYLALSLCLFSYAFVYTFFAYWYAQYLENPNTTFFYITGLIMPLLCIGLLIGLGAPKNPHGNLDTGIPPATYRSNRRARIVRGKAMISRTPDRG
ncbi:hypothetical protein Uis1B_0942 [Bifidobacterium margollesii]|uniref:Uncharacterized protein n=2 Tax=Bifidobacterium margollesii TaxID=2020964 RepID=A0A2N5JAG4_9BIFI|nr:hypothetical protein Uis1B_0942 [Bifidobacterium margollesii]